MAPCPSIFHCTSTSNSLDVYLLLLILVLIAALLVVLSIIASMAAYSTCQRLYTTISHLASRGAVAYTRLSGSDKDEYENPLDEEARISADLGYGSFSEDQSWVGNDSVEEEQEDENAEKTITEKPASADLLSRFFSFYSPSLNSHPEPPQLIVTDPSGYITQPLTVFPEMRRTPSPPSDPAFLSRSGWRPREFRPRYALPSQQLRPDRNHRRSSFAGTATTTTTTTTTTLRRQKPKPPPISTDFTTLNMNNGPGVDTSKKVLGSYLNTVVMPVKKIPAQKCGGGRPSSRPRDKENVPGF